MRPRAHDAFARHFSSGVIFPWPNAPRMKLFERERERERGWLGKETINTFPRGNETTWQWSPRIGGEGPVSTIHFAGLNWLRYFESGRALHTVEYGRDPTPRPEILHRQHRVSKRASHSRSRIWWRTCACNTCLCHGLSDYLRRVAHETSLTPLLSLSLSSTFRSTTSAFLSK